MASRIAVLFHRREHNPRRFVLDQLAEHWRKDGFEVIYLFGCQTYVPADILFLHVDLSVVPETYVNFSKRYPLVINGRLRDIRKSRFSAIKLSETSEWEGPVIVKSDLNYAGGPEHRAARWPFEDRWPLIGRARSKLLKRLNRRPPFKHPSEYRLYDSPQNVPIEVFRDNSIIVEQFLPEIENGLYHTRCCQVLGTRRICTRFASTEFVVKGQSSCAMQEVEPHPMVEEWQETYNIDYGKLDYVIYAGEPILLDINKTIGATGRLRDTPETQALRRELAQGIYDFLK